MKLLQNKNAVIYGAGGSMGGAVAEAMAAAGARIYAIGRSMDTLDELVKSILEAGKHALKFGAPLSFRRRSFPLHTYSIAIV